MSASLALWREAQRIQTVTSISSWIWSLGRSLFDLGGLLTDLQNLLGRQVDVITPDTLRPRIRDGVLREAVAL